MTSPSETEPPTRPPASEPEKKSGADAATYATRIKRGPKGQFLPGNPRPPQELIARRSPELKALCRMRTVTDLEKLDELVATAKDPWVVIECIKIRFQYGWGKPITVNGPAVQVNVGPQGVTVESSEDAFYRASLSRSANADELLALYAERRRQAAAVAIEGESAAADADTAAAPGGSG